MEKRKRRTWRIIAIPLAQIGLSCCAATLLLSCVLLWGGVNEGWFGGIADFVHGRRQTDAQGPHRRPRATFTPSPTPPPLARQENEPERPATSSLTASPTPGPPTPTASPTSVPLASGSPGSQDESIAQNTTERGPENAPLPALGMRLIIPALEVDAPVVEIPLRGGTWDVTGLSQEVAYLEGTARPGENGNVGMAGHVTLASGGYGPFKELDRLAPGDPVIIHADDQAHVYLVDYSKVVSAEAVEVVQPTGDPILTLITCVNWDTLHRHYRDRLIVVAHWIGMSAS